MRKLAFGYSTRCNLRCAHCVATEETPEPTTMGLELAKETIVDLARAGVRGISFSAGEPFLYFAEVAELVGLCQQLGIYTRVVSNSYWASDAEVADRLVAELKEKGLCQLRLSFSRWHQQQVRRENVLHAARSCQRLGLPCYISMVTDFSEEDDAGERFLRDHGLLFFPEPLIHAGRAAALPRREIRTDYQANRCQMNPYLTPELEMYACCDAGVHFTETDFFHLGSLRQQSAEELFSRLEGHPLYQLIRTMGLAAMASYSGIPAREIISLGRCELCRRLFNCPQTVARLQGEVAQLKAWSR